MANIGVATQSDGAQQVTYNGHLLYTFINDKAPGEVNGQGLGPNNWFVLDASGNPISYAGVGSKWFIYPEFGLQAQYFSGRHLRLEASAAGFAFPHKSTVWDADASVNYRVGKVELRVGAKAFHFKTNPGSDYYMWGTPSSAFIGLRWHSQ